MERSMSKPWPLRRASPKRQVWVKLSSGILEPRVSRPWFISHCADEWLQYCTSWGSRELEPSMPCGVCGACGACGVSEYSGSWMVVRGQEKTVRGDSLKVGSCKDQEGTKIMIQTLYVTAKIQRMVEHISQQTWNIWRNWINRHKPSQSQGVLVILSSRANHRSEVLVNLGQTRVYSLQFTI